MWRFIFFVVVADASIQIVDDFHKTSSSKGCLLNLTQNHAGWSINQPSREWTNVTFNATMAFIQVNAVDADTGAYVIGWTINYANRTGPVTMHVNYWVQSVLLYFSTQPAPCTRYKTTISYGAHTK